MELNIESLLLLFSLTALLVAIIAALFYVEYSYNVRRRTGDEPITSYSLGKRTNHPIWSWMVGIVLWSIMGFVGFSTVQYMLYGHHGPKFAEVFAHLFSSEEGADPKEQSSLLKEVAYQEYAERKSHFHNLAVDNVLEEKQPVCYYCHGNMPHKREKFIRVMMNMHTQFIGCLTCHVRNVDEKDIVLKWYNYSQVKVSGQPFGIDYDPETGALTETDDYYSKIVAFVQTPNGEKMLEIPEYQSMAQDFIKIRDRLTTDEQGKVKNKFHANVAPKGRFCSRCHTGESDAYIPYRDLGFSEKRIEDLTGLNIIGIVTKYKEFYIPTIFRGNEKPEEVTRIVGSDVQQASVNDELLKNPRSWWRSSYVPQERFPEKVWKK